MLVFLGHSNEAHIPAHIQNTQNLPKYFVYRGTPAHILAHSIKTLIALKPFWLKPFWLKSSKFLFIQPTPSYP